MYKKQTPEDLAQEAIELLDEAENFEEQKNWPKAIEKYQIAANYLQQSGYLSHRINDIYTRITEINNYLKQERAYQQSQAQIQQAQLDHLQDEAFTLLDNAKKQEEAGFLQNAIQKYMSAIKLLSQSGWSETQLENLQSKIMNLAQIFEARKQIQPDIQAPVQPQIGEVVSQPVVDKKAEALKVYEAKKKQEEDTQNQAFVYLDMAKNYEKDKKYDEAISNYQNAIELLNSLGWTQQTQNIQLIVDKLNKEREGYVSIQVQQEQIPISIDEKLLAETSISQSEIDSRKQKLIEFEQKKKHEKEIQNKAFKLIDTAKSLEIRKQYDEAIKNFEQSIDLLKSIGWDSYIQPIFKSINDIEERKAREIHAEEIKKKREAELTTLQQMIQTKQKEEFVQSDQDIELRRRQLEQKRKNQLQNEEEFYIILNQADKFIQVSNFDNAIKEYKKALDKLSSLGSGWESYIPTIQETISSIEQRKKAIIEKDSEIFKRKEEKKQKEIEFQQNVAKELKKERERLKQKELKLKADEEEIKYRENRKQTAFKFLDAGQKYLNQRDFPKALYAYQNAGNIFAEIQWTEELPLIENTIKEIESKKNEINLMKHQKLKKLLERRKKEDEFQKQITEQVNLEREKLLQKTTISAKQKEKLSQIEEKRAKAFKVLEEAEIAMKQSQYDSALEKYLKADIILSEIQYPTKAIREMVQKVREMSKEQEIQKQREKELAIQNEAEDKEFHLRIAENIEKGKKRLKEKQIILIKREQMQALLEKKREEVFNILDEAEKLTKDMEHNKAILAYRKAELILNELHFPTDSIKNMITNINNLKKEQQVANELEIRRELARFDEESQLRDLIEERRQQQRAETIARQIAESERERIIQAQMNAREAAYSLLEEAGKYLKRIEPDFDKGISLYIQARDFLAERIGWEPEINNMNRLIKDLQHEKAVFLEKRRRTKQAEFERLQEYISFQQEIKRRTEEHEQEEKRRRSELQEYQEKRRITEELKEQALGLIDEGKKQAKYGYFDDAYDLLNRALNQFRKLGWEDYIHFIETEINNTKLLEEKSREEEFELRRIHKELDRQVALEKSKREEEDLRYRKSIEEIGDLSDDVKRMIEIRREEIITAAKQKEDSIKREAKEFSRSMAKMMLIKQELKAELAKAKQEEAKKLEKIQKEKDRKELDDIAKMIKDVAKKKK